MACVALLHVATSRYVNVYDSHSASQQMDDQRALETQMLKIYTKRNAITELLTIWRLFIVLICRGWIISLSPLRFFIFVVSSLAAMCWPYHRIWAVRQQLQRYIVFHMISMVGNENFTPPGICSHLYFAKVALVNNDRKDTFVPHRA